MLRYSFVCKSFKALIFEVILIGEIDINIKTVSSVMLISQRDYFHVFIKTCCTEFVQTFPHRRRCGDVKTCRTFSINKYNLGSVQM